MTDPVRTAVLDLAARALHAAMAERWQTATSIVQAIDREHGADGVLAAMLAWADTCNHHKLGRFTADRPVAVFWHKEGSDQLEAADEVSPTARWAGRMLAARAADDPATWDALLASVPADPRVIGQHVAELLSMVAANLRDTPTRTESR